MSDFTDSLCLRRQISARDPTKTELKRDIPYTLDRVGNAKVKLSDGAGAGNAYFESLALRREIAASVDDNALYLGDVAVSLTLIGDYDRNQNDLKTALAFYAAASDVRLKVTLLTPTDDRAGKSLSDIRKKVDTLRNQVLDADPDADLSGNWWQGPVADAEKGHVKPKSPSNTDGTACLNRVVATVDQIVAPFVDWLGPLTAPASLVNQAGNPSGQRRDSAAQLPLSQFNRSVGGRCTEFWKNEIAVRINQIAVGFFEYADGDFATTSGFGLGHRRPFRRCRNRPAPALA